MQDVPVVGKALEETESRERKTEPDRTAAMLSPLGGSDGSASGGQRLAPAKSDNSRGSRPLFGRALAWLIHKLRRQRPQFVRTYIVAANVGRGCAETPSRSADCKCS